MSEPNPAQRKRFNFDPTINLGHLLTFGGCIGAGLIAYSSLVTRVTVVEQRADAIETRAREQDGRIKDTLGEIKADLREVRRGVEDLGRIKR
jgi:hypothetical protein